MASKSKTPVQLSKQESESSELTPSEAITKAIEAVKTKFDSSLELHIKLGIDTKKGDQQVRGTLTLPHGTGKTKRVAAFVDPDNEKAAKDAGADIIGGEEVIQDIASTEKIDFDEAIATPQMMSKLAKIAKVLGPKGMMPSPKNETVGTNVSAMVLAIKAGKISFKNDDTGNLHLLIGKISFGKEKLLANFAAALDAVRRAKPLGVKGIYIKNIYLSSTMGKSIKVEVPG